MVDNDTGKLGGTTQNHVRLRPVSHWLDRVKDPYVKENHPLKHYQLAFKGFERLGTGVIGGGYH